MMNSKGITEDERIAVVDGINTLLKEVDTNSSIQIANLGYWNEGDREYQSADWYIKQAETSHEYGKGMQVNADIILYRLPVGVSKKVLIAFKSAKKVELSPDFS